ncbi:S-adenosylmethionine:tRNA ribosyltransferase-isomerase [Paenibacillus koleovorans]|uniref:S-adenosylmethionine:tRNA ribosyltransferase-isomerase n=1 Tax=Paenibacillus koleovorans TaxID=121608 RepID=UPI000FD76B5E|nr:S-adenosylmethionine:tRNA ribosyltransferase-isomerase [Paenibacillus koleovorans]
MDARLAHFELPDALNATMPPERREIRRDHVRMMVLDRLTGQTTHARFYELERFLRAGDLLVLNSSRTIPAILYGAWERGGIELQKRVELRLARRVDEESWDVLPVVTGGSRSVAPGDTFRIKPSLVATAAECVGEGFCSPLLVRIVFSCSGTELMDQIYALGEPIRYEYIKQPWELDYYQTVYASTPGSVEMPSAGRAFSWELLFKLQRRGVQIAYVELHTGLSYWLEEGGHPAPEVNYEKYVVPAEAVEQIRETRKLGGRVVAVGTTVVRALESAVGEDGVLLEGAGWTNLFIDRTRPLRVTDGLITGFHEPEASHLDMLSAFIDPELLGEAYQEAIAQGYLWHEFGDMNLIL